MKMFQDINFILKIGVLKFSPLRKLRMQNSYFLNNENTNH